MDKEKMKEVEWQTTKNSESGISWQAPEHEYIEKTPDWFWTIGIIVVVVVFVSFFYKSFMTGILAIISGFSLALYGSKRPKTITFKIDSKGILAGDQIYEYENLDSFWINSNPPHANELIVKSKRSFSPQIVFLLENADPTEIREYLSQFLPEEKMEGSLIATISRILKF